MTFNEWQKFARKTQERADRVTRSIISRARNLAPAFGGSPDGVFLLAHNWTINGKVLTPGTPEFRAARRVLHLQELSYQPHRIAARVIERAWKTVPAI